ncbi:hypothetical protein [Peptoniphilus sp.]|uniref:hypothetical protein n=1 Tax=Peptoniphilus sp. TaxID=1971214 RepID=UPI003992C549
MIVLTVNGEPFLLESDKVLSVEDKDEIELICKYFYDEDNEWYDKIYDMSEFDIAELFQKVVKEETGINVIFKCIDLEVSINED